MLISVKRSDKKTSSTVVYKQLVKGHILSIYMNKKYEANNFITVNFW